MITFGQQEFTAEVSISILNSATFEDKEEPRVSEKHQSKGPRVESIPGSGSLG